MSDPALEFAWLLERQIAGRAVWWGGSACGRDWTTDASEAVRFPRMVDAERAGRMLGPPWNAAIATEHGWS